VGLLCFDRDLQQWSQRIIPGVPPDHAVSDVHYANGEIRVTIGEDVHRLIADPSNPNRSGAR
jgi:hypothetical protein